MDTSKQIPTLLSLLAIGALAVACYIVMQPFLTAVLWSGILAFSTWPIFSRMDEKLAGRRTLSATIMTLFTTLVLVAPFALVIATLADNTAQIVQSLGTLLDNGLPLPPAYVANIPVVGETVAAYWTNLTNDGVLAAELKRFGKPAGQMALTIGTTLGSGILELCLSIFITFFIYQSGSAASDLLTSVMHRITPRAERLLEVAGATIKGVVYSVIGTAIAQGVIAAAGFWIAGIPGALLLGFLTFVLSLIPGGPAFIWVPAVFWLISKQEWVLAAFLFPYGIFAISGIDNYLKPYLIKRALSTVMTIPFILILFGALGGVLALGFIGLFLGPTILAVGYYVLTEGLTEETDTPQGKNLDSNGPTTMLRRGAT